ncbi:MAG: phage/plasmid primase, P4 family, partial [Desulfurobacteriaceae bacterium]
ITVAVPACPGDCQLVRKLKAKQPKNSKVKIKVVDKFYPELIARELLDKFDFWYEGERRDFWIFDQEDGVWKDKAEDILKHFLYDSDFLDAPLKKRRYINELVEAVKNLTFRENPFPDPPPELIPFKNGVYDLEKDTFRPYRKDDYFTFRLPWNYKEGAQCPLIDRVFHSLLPEDRVIDLYELVAYCLWRGYPYQKFFILYGKGRNGKSAYVQILTHLIGDTAYSSVPLEELLGGGFQLSELYRKLANISGELSYNDIKESSYLKMLTGEDAITASRKFKKPITFRNYAKMIFLTNQVPLTHDTTEAFYRRVFLIEFPYKFLSKEELELHLKEGYPRELLRLRDPKLLQQILRTPSEFEGLAYKSIQILKRLKSRGFVFTNDRPVEELRALYDRVSNPLLQFIEEFCVRDPEGVVFKREFREKFWEWQRAKGIPKWTNTQIGTTMKDVLGFSEGRRTNPATGKQDWAWLGLKWNDYYLLSSSIKQKRENIQSIQTIQGNPKKFSKIETRKTFQKRVDTLDTLDITTAVMEEELPPEVVEDFCSLSEEELKEFEELERELNEAKDDLGSYITEEDKAKKALEKLKDSPVLYLDIETFSKELPTKKGDEPALDPFRNKVRLISLGDGERFFTFDLLRLPEGVVKDLLELISKKLVVGHNLKFDLKTLAYHYGREILPQRTFDTYIAEKLIWNAQNPGRPKKGELSLKTLAAKYAGVELDKELQTSNWAGELSFEQVEYALNDVRVLPQIVKKQVEILNGLSPRKAKPNPVGLESPVARLEMAFLPVLVEIELSGVPVNEDYLRREFRENRRLFREIYTELKEKFQIDPQSPKQLLNLLKNRLGLQVE